MKMDRGTVIELLFSRLNWSSNAMKQGWWILNSFASVIRVEVAH